MASKGTNGNTSTLLSDLIETSARGTLLGSRGILHDRQGRIVEPLT